MVSAFCLSGRCGVRKGLLTEVEEELGQDVESEQALLADLVVGETDDAEEDGEERETHQLNGLAANGINGGNRDPVTGDGTGADEDEVTNGGVEEVLVHVLGVARAVANLGQNNRVVETETVEGNIQEEPGTGRTEKNLAILPLGVVGEEVLPRGLGNLELGRLLLHGLDTGNLIGNTLVLASLVGLDVGTSLDNITSDIEGVAGSLRDGQTVVEGNAAGDGAETNDDTPHLVDGQTADASAGGRGGGALKRLLEASSDDQSDDSSTKLAETLHGEDGTHHSSSPLGGSESRIGSVHCWQENHADTYSEVMMEERG